MNKTVFYKILRWATVLLAVIFLVVLSGKAPETTATFAQLEAAVNDEVDLSLMQEAGADKLSRFYGLNAAEFKNFILYYPTDFMSVEEVLLIEMVDETQKELVLDAIDARLDTQKENFENYGSDGQYEKLCTNAVTEIRGNFVLFAVHEDAVVDAFLKTV